MVRRAASLFALALVAAVAAWWAIRTLAPAPPPEVGAHPRSTESPPPPPAEPAAPDPSRHEEAPAAGAAAAQRPVGTPDDPLEAWRRDPTRGVAVTGTIVVVDEDGGEHGGEDGKFTAFAWRNDRVAGGPAVQVQAGRFELHAPAGCILQVSSLELGGRDALVTNGTPPRSGSGQRGSTDGFPIKEEGPLRVAAQWPHRVRIHARDAATKLELHDVEILTKTQPWWTGDVIHPGALDDAKRVAEHADSPIELDGPRPHSPLTWTQDLWIHAPRRTWARVHVDFRKGGESTVELAAGADLEITIVGDIPPAPEVERLDWDRDDLAAVLRLCRPGAIQVLLERPPRPRGPTLVEGLPAGAFTLSLERGQHWDRPLVLAKTDVELREGERTRAQLTVDARPAERRVPLAGTLHLSPAWECRWLDLRFEPADVKGGTSLELRSLSLADLKPVDETPGLYRFRVAPVLPGLYVVKSYTYSFQQTVDTGPDGREDLALQIGDPVDVVVHLLDARDDRPLDEEGLLLWNLRWPKESTGGGLLRSKFDRARGGYVFRAPEGEVELHAGFQTGRFEPLESPFIRVGPGADEFTVRVRSATGVRVWFERDGARVDWPAGAKVRVASTAGVELDPQQRFGTSDGILIHVPSAGAWRLLVEGLDGDEPVAPIDFTVSRGEIASQPIALHRR